MVEAPVQRRQQSRRALGERLRQLRLQRGLTQEEIAARLGYSDGWVSLVETGRRGLSPDTLKQYAEVLGTTVDEIMATAPVPLLPVSRWAPHPYRRAQDEEEVVVALKMECPIHDEAAAHQALWLVYRTGLTRVVCPRCGQYQVG